METGREGEGGGRFFVDRKLINALVKETDLSHFVYTYLLARLVIAASKYSVPVKR